MADAREIIARAAHAFEAMPHMLRYGLYDYSSYTGNAPPHVVTSPSGEAVLRTHNAEEARREYERFRLHHRGEYIEKALSAAGYRILGPDEVDPATVERCAEVAGAAEVMRVRLFEENEASINAHKAVQAHDIASEIRALLSKEAET